MILSLFIGLFVIVFIGVFILFCHIMAQVEEDRKERERKIEELYEDYKKRSRHRIGL